MAKTSLSTAGTTIRRRQDRINTLNALIIAIGYPIMVMLLSSAYPPTIRVKRATTERPAGLTAFGDQKPKGKGTQRPTSVFNETIIGLVIDHEGPFDVIFYSQVRIRCKSAR
jgi:hypothetical protein